MSAKQFTFFLHTGSKALGQPTEATLVAFVLVDQAIATETTRVNLIFANTSTEKALNGMCRNENTRYA